jgi:hypothetical protein
MANKLLFRPESLTVRELAVFHHPTHGPGSNEPDLYFNTGFECPMNRNYIDKDCGGQL